MKQIFKYKWGILAGVVLFVLYFTSRFYNLTLIPIFTDEAIYVRWAQIANYDASWRFISLTDGKQPLFIWLMIVVMRIFDDPLFAGRAASVLTGLGTMIGLFFLSGEIFKSKKVGVMAMLLYFLYPFALVYDRMALMDGMVGMFAVWSLLLEIVLVRTLRLDVALILGMVVGGSVLTKSSGFFNLYLLPFSLILFPWFEKERNKKLLLWLGLISVAVIESQIIYSVLRLSPFFHIITEKNALFVYPFNEWLDHPLRFLEGNLRGLWDWFITYFRWPMAGMVVLALLTGRRYLREAALLLIWFGLPFFLLALFGKVLYPRFIFFMTLSLLPLLAFGFFKFYALVKKPIIFVACFLVLASLWLFADWRLLTNPYIAPIPESDKDQYLNSWPAGGGIKETIAFLEQESKKGKIYVATEGTFGLLPASLEIYLNQNKEIEIKGFWPLEDPLPEEIIQKSKELPVYLITNRLQVIPEKWPVSLVSRFQKGTGKDFLAVYKVD